MAGKIVDADISSVKALLQKALNKSDFVRIERMGGLTNRTYMTEFSENDKYIVRIPGEGTEELIVRSDEKASTELACRIGVDAKLIYFGDDGSKVTEYIPNARTMCAQTMREPKHILMAAEIYRKMHNCNADTGVPFEVFDMACGYEKIIADNNVSMYDDYPEIKAEVMKIKSEIDSICDIKKVPCHNDPLCENWIMSGDERMYLVDWEYAGMNDGLWDLADLSIEASYESNQDQYLLECYFERKPTDKEKKHFVANKLYVDYLWTLWAKTRVPYDGQPMEDWAAERYARLKNNIKAFHEM